MEQQIVFGTAYYPEYMPYERTELDAEMMKQAGMNVIRVAESTWSTMEPTEGSYQFGYLDRVIEAAQKYDMKLIIGTPSYAIPPWLAARAEGVMVTDVTGTARYGHRQKMNLISPDFRFYCERIIRRLMEHTAHLDCVIGFQLDNETKHYGMADEGVQRLFRAHLKRKFTTVEAMNRAYGLAYWSNSIGDWADMPDIRGCVNGGLMAEFDRFRRSLAADYLDWQAKIVSEYKRADQFLTHNFDFEWKKFGADIAQDGYSYGVQPDMNHYEASKCLTLSGCDIYHPTQDQLTGAEIAFCGDSIRSLNQAPYLVLECQAQAFKYWTPYPGQLRLQAYSHLASGACGILYWNWHSIHNGYETYWKGLLSHDLETNKTYEEACGFGKEWVDHKQALSGLTKQNKIALVVDTHSLTAFKWFPIDRDLSYNDVVRSIYDCLYECNIECDVVDAAALDPGQYKMILTPALYSAGEELIESLKNFVAQGGILVSTFKSFVADDNLSVYHDRQPHQMTDCFGMHYSQFTEPGTARIGGDAVTSFAELLQPGTARVLYRYEHPYWKEYAGVTENEFGQGKAYYIGCYASRRILKEIIHKAYAAAADRCEEMKAAGELIVKSGISYPLILKSGVNGQGKKLHYILNYSGDEAGLFCPCKQAKSVLEAKRYEEGDPISLEGYGVLVLEEETI